MLRLAAVLVLSLASLSVSAQALNPVPQGTLADPTPRPSAQPANELDAKLANVADVSELEALAARYRLAKDADSEGRVWARLVKLRPHTGQYKLEMAAAYAQQDLKSFTYNALLELQSQGFGFDISQDERFAKVRNTEVWTYVLQGFDANRKPFGKGKTVYTLPAEDLLIESLAWDPGRKALLVGSAREGAVYVVDEKGGMKPLLKADAENGMWAVFDIAIDVERGVLWVASTAVPHFKRYNAEKDLGRAGIFKFDLKTGKFLKRFLSPTMPGQAFFMSNLTLAKNGIVFAADGVNNAVYVVAGDTLQRLFHAPALGSIRGLAVNPDNSILYFADYQRGLFGYDLKERKPFELIGGKTLTQGGIEGVLWWRGQLAVIQNGMLPKRIMRLKLSEDGRRVGALQPLDANQPDLSMPTLGTLDGDRLLLIGNSQKGQYDRFGLPIDASKLQGARIYALDLNFGDTPEAKPE